MATSVTGQVTGDGANILVVDDPHNVMEGESNAAREQVLQLWDEGLPTRLNNPKEDAFIVVGQRIHESDLSGHILSKEADGWVHLCLPARYEPDHPYSFPADPRTEPGEPLWKGRFGDKELRSLEISLGPYAAAGQLQQLPAPREGGMFEKDWFEIVRAVPAGGMRVRAWDLAGTDEKKAVKSTAYTAGVRMYLVDGTYYIEDVTRDRAAGSKVDNLLLNTATQDGQECPISIPQDPGSAGKSYGRYLVKILVGFIARATPESGSKELRAEPLSAQAQAGNVKLVKGAWNEAFLNELALFPNSAIKDQVDAASRAFDFLTGRRKVPGPRGTKK